MARKADDSFPVGTRITYEIPNLGSVIYERLEDGWAGKLVLDNDVVTRMSSEAFAECTWVVHAHWLRGLGLPVSDDDVN